MIGQADPHPLVSLTYLLKVVSAFAVFAGCLVRDGSLFDISTFKKSMLHGLVTMRPNTSAHRVSIMTGNKLRQILIFDEVELRIR